MMKAPREVNGFVALPLRLPATQAYPVETTHYIYLKPHDPNVPDEDASRSLFLVNIPVSTTLQSLKDLFTTNLEGGVIEMVHFSETAPGKGATSTPKSRKRKRMTAEEIETGLETYSLPAVWDTPVHKSGANAIVVFVDKSAMDLTLKAARRAAKSGTFITWPEGTLGLARYESYKQSQFPPPKSLLRAVNAYMTAFSALEESRSRDNARRRALPDEDGFVTVTRGSKGSVRMEEAKEAAERVAQKVKEKAEGTEDFYRFQNREKRKERQEGLVRRFEEDKRRVEEMRSRRRKTS
ncbi:hypothetical protein H2200_009521 [Cladophialophora chaetospira]|uniref:Ribosomal RNA-processing protein 7 n=1 Tax=Cladophialophora chaetospira TaxID=386627 RepID=A0AA38X2W7_9EURO|nr:hypothetical protein H2200_009521 [Cladophialophora chaetospira]